MQDHAFGSALGEGFGRREFLKGSAATLGVVALSGFGCSPEPELEGSGEPIEAPAEEVYQGVCRGNCGGGCRMNVHVRDGKVVKTSRVVAEDPLDTRLCQKGLSHAQRIYAPERIQYPMRRVDGTPRGGGEWERITWEDAIAEIASKWQGWFAEYGGTAVAVYRGGAGTYAYNQYVYTRLCNMFGGVNLQGNYDMAALEMANEIAANFTAPYLAGNDCSDVKHSKYIFSWACNASLSTLPRQSYVHEALKNGAKRIVIDPIYTDTAARADMWVPIRPATDGALAMAMTNYIIQNGKADEAYLRDCTVAPLLVKADTGKFLRMSDLGVEPTEGPMNPLTGQVTMIDPLVVVDGDGNTGVLGELQNPVIHGSFDLNGCKVATAYDLLIERLSPWTVEKASEVCDIPAETIVELAEMYVEGPSNLELGFGNDHWGNGATITHCQFTLAMVAGQFGIKGGGVSGTQGASTNGIPGANYLGMYYPEGAQYTGLSPDFGDFHDIVATGKYGDRDVIIKSLMITTGNPLACSPNRNQILKTIEQMELIVTCDWLMTDSARYSDIVLPVAHWFEFEAINPCPTPYADFQEICVPPQFECKPDVEICKLLGAALGFAEATDHDDESWNKVALDSETCRTAGITWERVKEEKHVRFAPSDYYYGSREVPFLTPTGRGQFYLENVVPRYPHGQVLDTVTLALPSFELPDEGWNEGAPDYPKYELAEKYPLVLLSHRDKFKVHTTFAPHPWFLEIQPEPTIGINPVDAEARGIKENDYVRAFNDRGYCVFRAHLDASLRPGMTITEHTWTDEQYVDGHYCSLTSHKTSQFKPAPHPFDTLIEVEVYEGGNI